MKANTILSALLLIFSLAIQAQTPPSGREKAKTDTHTTLIPAAIKEPKNNGRLDPDLTPIPSTGTDTVQEIPNTPATQKPLLPADNETQPQLILSITVLVFGLIILLSILYAIHRQNKGFNNTSFKIFGITLILISSIFLVVAGYSQEQITPVIGLLGTLAGFVFGTNLNSNSSSSNTTSE